MPEIILIASINSVKCDREGAWRIILDVPKSESIKVAQLTAMVELELSVTLATKMEG